MKQNNYCGRYHSPAMEVLNVSTDSIIAESFGEKSGEWASSPGGSDFFLDE